VNDKVPSGLREFNFGWPVTQSPLFSPDERTFTVASDDALVALVSSASQRLVIVSPALSDAVVDAVITQLAQRPTLSVTIILDADPEVYRFDFGSEKALKRLHETCVANDLAVRKQPAAIARRDGLLNNHFTFFDAGKATATLIEV